MRPAKRFGRSSDRPEERSERNDSGRGRFERRDSGRPGRDSKLEMFEVICDECGRKCEVPFKPTTSKPVYCSDCFKKKGNSKGSFNKSSGQSSEELEQINRKLDKIMKALGIE